MYRGDQAVPRALYLCFGTYGQWTWFGSWTGVAPFALEPDSGCQGSVVSVLGMINNSDHVIDFGIL